ncbi:TerD family protein [Kitasatospora sp. NPDC088391]|uniref:TerD family protein n=1 Tax=Kitasatospora sp. NPDC088391 TaxID=3364074 RepID=UPI00382AE1F3
MTHVMAKGANIPLTAAAVRAVLRWTDAPGVPDLDASALLLDDRGKVRDDTDFVFYNQPRHPSGLVRHLPKQTAGGEVWDALEIDLAQLPPEVDRVVLAGSAEGGSFPSVPGLRVLLFDAGAPEGTPALAEFAVDEDEQVTALVAAELYRRAGGWKFRAVGQGYLDGLVALATDFGIAVDDGMADGMTGGAPAEAAPGGSADPRAPRPAPLPVDEDDWTLAPAAPVPAPPPAPEPEERPAAAPPAPVTAPPPPAQPPTAHHAAPTGAQPPVPVPGGYGYPQAQQPQQPGYGYPPPPPQQHQPHPQAGGYGYPQPQAGGYGYPQAQPRPQQPGPGYGYPQQGTHQQPAQQQPAPQPAPQQPQQPGPPFALPPQGPQFQPR